MTVEEPRNPFWEYSLSVYDDEVAACCLTLQDSRGLDVNLLLYGGWLARRGLRLTQEHLRSQNSAVAGWREEVVMPLRDLRRRLDRRGPGSALREKLKRLELEAERYQQDILYRGSRVGEAPLADRHPLRENLGLVAALGGGTESDWGPQVARLAALLSARSGLP